MHKATDSIEVKATAEQSWKILSDLSRLPEWYVPAQSINVITDGPIGENWQFILAVKTLSGLVLKALGTVNEFDPQNKVITWRGQAMGIAGDSRWQVISIENDYSRIDHSFQGDGWLMFLSQKLGRNKMTVRKRLTHLKTLVELEISNQFTA